MNYEEAPFPCWPVVVGFREEKTQGRKKKIFLLKPESFNSQGFTKSKGF